MSDPSSVYLIAAILLLPFMISSQSFWIDEGSTGLFARKPDFRTWWRYLDGNTSSETQMPLYLFFTHVWAKVAGSSEWALRAINLIWGALTLWALAIVGDRLHLPWLPLFCAIQPYFWFYIGEARSYSLQIMLGSWLLVAFDGFLQTNGSDVRWPALFTGVSLVLFCTTMLAPIALFSIGIVAATLWHRSSGVLAPGTATVLACGVLISLPLVAYYARTLARGAKGAELWRVDARYLGYVAYEMVGLTGLGPATADVRGIVHSSPDLSGLIRHFRNFVGPILGSLALAVIIYFGTSEILDRPATRSGPGVFLAVFVVGTLLFFIGSFFAQKAFWGRHYAPLFPFYVVGVALILSHMWQEDAGWLYQGTAALFVVLLVVSSLSLRFAERHRRDDYRAAAAHARSLLESGKSVWWIAGPEAAEYYGLPLAYEEPRQGFAFSPRGHTGIPSTMVLSHDLARLLVPDIVIISKPDTYDVPGTATACIQRNQFRQVLSFKTFTVWAAPDARAA